jgi:hypothetical protein
VQVKGEDLIPVVLLLMFGMALAAGTLMVTFVRRWRRQRIASRETSSDPGFFLFPSGIPHRTAFLQRPIAWLAIRSRNPGAVQSALALHNAKPCAWPEAVADDRHLFIAPPVHGWILVFGSGLPDPAGDVDAAFQFLTRFSRKVGQVQFFQADPVSGNHAWAKLDSGRVTRGYAWAGGTVWNQGIPTAAEAEIGMRCLQYFETVEPAFDQPDFAAVNVEKIPQLAARWSLDPFSIDERAFTQALGITGEL